MICKIGFWLLSAKIGPRSHSLQSFLFSKLSIATSAFAFCSASDRGDLPGFGDMNQRYKLIVRLMDATYKAKDQGLKLLLASLKYKARQCKVCIEGRMGVKN